MCTVTCIQIPISKLINKSVSGTVDMRALSKVSGSPEQRAEAIRDNMTLVVESARAIGCRVDDSTTDDIVQKDPGTISNFLVDLIRVSLRVMTRNNLIVSIYAGPCSALAWHGR